MFNTAFERKLETTSDIDFENVMDGLDNEDDEFPAAAKPPQKPRKKRAVATSKTATKSLPHLKSKSSGSTATTTTPPPKSKNTVTMTKKKPKISDFVSSEAEEDNRAFVSEEDAASDDDDVVESCHRDGGGRVRGGGDERKRNKRRLDKKSSRRRRRRNNESGSESESGSGSGSGSDTTSSSREKKKRRSRCTRENSGGDGADASAAVVASSEKRDSAAVNNCIDEICFDEELKQLFLRNYTGMNDSLAEKAFKGNVNKSIIDCPNVLAGSDTSAYNLLARLDLAKCLDELCLMNEKQRIEIKDLVTEVSRALWRVGKFAHMFDLDGGGITALEADRIAETFSFDETTDQVLSSQQTRALSDDPVEQKYMLFTLFGTLDRYVRGLLTMVSVRRGGKYDRSMKDNRFAVLSRIHDDDHLQYLQRCTSSIGFAEDKDAYKLKGFYLISLTQRKMSHLRFPVFVDHGNRLAEVMLAFIREKCGELLGEQQLRVFVNLTKLQSCLHLNVLNNPITDVAGATTKSSTAPGSTQQHYGGGGGGGGGVSGGGGAGGNSIGGATDETLALVDMSNFKYDRAKKFFIVKGYIVAIFSSTAIH